MNSKIEELIDEMLKAMDEYRCPKHPKYTGARLPYRTGSYCLECKLLFDLRWIAKEYREGKT